MLNMCLKYSIIFKFWFLVKLFVIFLFMASNSLQIRHKKKKKYYGKNYSKKKVKVSNYFQFKIINVLLKIVYFPNNTSCHLSYDRHGEY